MTRSTWGWGVEEAAVTDAEVAMLRERVAPLVGSELEWSDPAPLAEAELPVSRLPAPPAAIARLVDDGAVARAGHTYGKSFRDVVRGLAGDLRPAPDAVAFPRGESDVEAVLDWASDIDAVVVPYGGGSSVVGGVETPIEVRGDRPVVCLDLGGLRGVLELDRTSRAARIAAGTYGPALEDELRPQGLTLRHYPQSFEFSTLGGWLATRSGGHFATLHTHLDDFVESIRAITPSGLWASRRLPGSGAGPSPDRMLLGSEGTLGVITEAWMRVMDRPVHRGSFVAAFDTFAAAADAARVLAHSGLWPQNCRVLDALEAFVNGAGDGSAHLLLVGFESAHVPVDVATAAARELVADHGGRLAEAPARRRDRSGGDPAEQWRGSFLRAPYLRDGLVRLGLITETFETAVTWDRFDELVGGVRDATTEALVEVGCGPTPLVTCRLTHVYPDGAAPYFTVIAPGRPGTDRLAQWEHVKTASMAAIDRLGGTVTHHHAVGRDHRPGYDRQRPAPFAAALRAAKSELDPSWMLNPGVLIDP